MNFEQALRAISQPIRATALPDSLDHMHRLLDALGSPQQDYPSVVVAGSVGKGTTCHQLATLLNPHLKVGLFTSPHLHSFRERFSINGVLIAQGEFIEGVSRIQQAAAQLDTHYSTFEMSTALALWWFRQQAVDIAVLEIGIGGRFDAVNVVANTLALITPIELEHAAMLGGTLTSIAGHKAGIIQPQGYTLAAPQQPEVEAVLRHEAATKHAHLQFEPITTLALAACNNLLQRGILPPFDLPAATPPVNIPARLEHITLADKSVLIDGAHTLGSAQRLLAEIERLAPQTPVRLIIGILRDKAIQSFVTLFDDPRYHIVLTQLPGHRAASAGQIHQSLALHHAHMTLQAVLQTALEEALAAPESLIVVTGSLRTAALAREYLGLLNDEEREEALLTRHIFEGAEYLAKLR